MNQLHAYGAKIDCEDLKVTSTYEKGQKVYFYGQREGKPCSLIFAIKANKLLCQGCGRYWCYVMDIQEREGTADSIHIVCKFEDVFSQELLGLPPWRKINFEIELVPGSQAISKTPYRMAPIERKKLKTQLEDLLHKGFI